MALLREVFGGKQVAHQGQLLALKADLLFHVVARLGFLGFPGRWNRSFTK
jgi:hypothetical protein